MDKKENILISSEYIEKLPKVAEGKCANVYRDGNVAYKMLKQNSDSKRLYSKEMLQQLVGTRSDLCIFPNEILCDNNGNLLGYSMEFVNGRKLKDIITMLPFEQLQSAIIKAVHGIREISEQNIMFDDMHDDNVMWNEDTQTIQIIDTDFFKKVNDNTNLYSINYQIFCRTIQYIIDSRIQQYGRTENEELIPFYNLKDLEIKDGKQLSLSEYISNLKSVIGNDFDQEFKNLNEIEIALKERQEEIEEQQHLERIANNLTIKEKFIKFLAQSKHIRKIPFVSKLIDKQIKMLPADLQQVVNKSNTEVTQTKVVDFKERANNFCQELRNWPTQKIEERKENVSNQVVKKKRDNSFER